MPKVISLDDPRFSKKKFPRTRTVIADILPPFEGKIKIISKDGSYYYLRYDEFLRRYILTTEVGELVLSDKMGDVDDSLYMFFTRWNK